MGKRSNRLAVSVTHLAAMVFRANSPGMTFIDTEALRATWAFMRKYMSLIGVGAAIYAIVFAAQSVSMAHAGAYMPGAAPLTAFLILLAFMVFACVLAGWGRAALDKPNAGLAIGADEGRLLWVSILILVLVFTILGTALVALTFMLAGLALVQVDATAEPPEGAVRIFELFGTGEWIVAIILMTSYGLFSLWLFLRLAIAYPATIDQGRIMVLSAWPVSGQRRAGTMIISFLLVSLPGVFALWGLSQISSMLLGASPAEAHNAAQDGALIVNPLAFALVSFVYGAAKMALIGAPCAGVLCALYNRWKYNTPLFEPEQATPT